MQMHVASLVLYMSRVSLREEPVFSRNAPCSDGGSDGGDGSDGGNGGEGGGCGGRGGDLAKAAALAAMDASWGASHMRPSNVGTVDVLDAMTRARSALRHTTCAARTA